MIDEWKILQPNLCHLSPCLIVALKKKDFYPLGALLCKKERKKKKKVVPLTYTKILVSQKALLSKQINALAMVAIELLPFW